MRCPPIDIRPSVRPSICPLSSLCPEELRGRKEGRRGGGRDQGGRGGLPSPTGTPPPPPPTPIGRPAPTDGRAKEASFLASSRMERGKGGLRTLSLSTASYLLLLLLLPACSLFSGRPQSQGTPPPPPLMPPLRSKGQQRRRQLRSLFSPSSEGRERSGCCGRALLFPSRRQVDLLLRPFVADRPYGRRAERRAGGRTAPSCTYATVMVSPNCRSPSKGEEGRSWRGGGTECQQMLILRTPGFSSFSSTPSLSSSESPPPPPPPLPPFLLRRRKSH